LNHLRLIRAPDYVYAHSNKGIALTCLGDLQAMLSRHYEASECYAQAIAAFDEALSRAPGDVYAHNNKGLALRNLGDSQAKLSRRDDASKNYAEAIAAFDVALHIAPDHVQIHNNRANVLKSLGELQARLSQRDEASPLEGERMPTIHKKLYQVFLSHSSGDKAHVEKIAVRLVNEAGINPFLDKWHLVPGEPWQEALEEALGESETCAVFLGPAGLGPWENEEMRAALDERVKDKSLRVIPVLLPRADPKDNKTLPRFLRRLTWVDFRTGIDEEEPFHRLVAGIKGQSPGRGPSQPVRTYIPPVSASIVRSWFNNVINPVLSQLRRELPYLEKKEWSWQVSPRRLECIHQINFSLTHAEDTFNQLLRFYPDIKEMFRLYEQGGEHKKVGGVLTR